MKLDNNMLILVIVVVAIGLTVYFNKNEGFDNKLDRIPWHEICKKEYCDLPNYYNNIYPNKNKYKANSIYSVNGKCCLLSEDMLKCLSNRGSKKHCKFLFP
mgnify:CR=1 FL=1|jgi:hypothetical protein